MQFRSFKNPLELNFIGNVWNLRLGTAQIALWRNYQAIFNFRPHWRRQTQNMGTSRATTENQIYGWFDDASGAPSYDPPHDASCLFCGKGIVADDVRTHSLMFAGPVYAKRSYFYRTHRTCAETDPTHTAMDGIVLDMIARNGD